MSRIKVYQTKTGLCVDIYKSEILSNGQPLMDITYDMVQEHNCIIKSKSKNDGSILESYAVDVENGARFPIYKRNDKNQILEGQEVRKGKRYVLCMEELPLPKQLLLSRKARKYL